MFVILRRFGLHHLRIVFLIILITLGVLHVLESRDIQGINHVRNDAMELHKSLRDPRCSEILQCNFWCMDLMYNEVSSFVEPIVGECSKIVLELKSCDFLGNNIPSNWLSDLAISLDELLLDEAKFSGFDPNAFIAETFHHLQILNFRNGNIDMIGNNSFNGLSKLNRLSFEMVDIGGFEDNVLAPMNESLQILVISENKYSFNLDNILGTGSVMLTGIRVLDIDNDNWRDIINRNTFTAVRNTESLYLGSSSITSIGESSFDPFKYTIKLIDLSNNFIVQLPDFPLEIFNGQIAIDMLDNEWNCDCPISLQHQMITYSSAFRNINHLTCSNGMGFVIEVECDEPIVEPTHPPEISTSTVSDETIDNGFLLKCQRLDRSTDDEFDELIIPYNDVQFTIHQISESELKISFLELTAANFILIWFPYSNGINGNLSSITLSNSISCYSNLPNDISISNLVTDNPYLFCLSEVPLNSFTPLNCKAFSLRALDAVSTNWINFAFKYKFIPIIIVVLFICCGLTALSTYYVMRYNANRLTKSRTSPVLINYSSSTTPITDSSDGIEMANHSSSSNSSSSQQGLIRSSSDTSVNSGLDYVQANGPSPIQLIAWKMNLDRQCNVEHYRKPKKFHSVDKSQLSLYTSIEKEYIRPSVQFNPEPIYSTIK